MFFSLISSLEGSEYHTEAIDYFLAGRGLDRTSNLTQENLDSILKVIKVLRDNGADTGGAKDYLKKLREQHRNIPDAVKYIDKISESLKSSWWSW